MAGVGLERVPRIGGGMKHLRPAGLQLWTEFDRTPTGPRVPGVAERQASGSFPGVGAVFGKSNGSLTVAFIPEI